MRCLLTICFLLLAANASASFQPLEEFLPNLGKNESDFSNGWKPQVAARPSVGLDAQGRVTSITNATDQVTRFSYNDAGNLDWRINGEQEQTDYDYDSLNRLTNVVHESVQKASYKYDPNGNLVEQTSLSAQIQLGYDEMNRMVASTSTISTVSTALTVGFAYDLNGNRTNIVYPGGLTVSYNYGADNRLESVTTEYTENTESFVFGYDTANRMDSISYPNGVNSTFGHDAEGRITNIVHGTFVNRQIIRNPLGFKTTELINAGIKPSVPTTQRSIKTHNDADQLTHESIQTDTTNWTDVAYNYNDNGGLETVLPDNEPSTSYTYDYDNRLESVGSMTSSTEYLYDASGARIVRIHNAVTNYFVVDYVDGLKRPLAEADSLGNITRYYVWNGSQLLCHIDTVAGGGDPGGSVYYYHADELGSTLALTDEAGNVTDEFAYMPYGYATHTAYAGSSETQFQWLGGYGVYYDSDTDLHLTLHRAYSSKLKRFVQPDPLGIDGFVHLYAYGDLNPTYFVDPTGEYAWVIAGAIIGAAIDGGIDLAMQMRSGDTINWKQFGAATARGAIVGTVSSLAGPAAGTLVKGAGGLATGLGAKVVSTGISAAGSAAGQTAYNAALGNGLSDGVGAAALFGAAGQGVANAFPVKGMSTLAQAKYFAPKRLSSLFATKNAKILSASILSSSSVGSGSYFIPQVEQSQPSMFNSPFSPKPSLNYGGISRGISK